MSELSKLYDEAVALKDQGNFEAAVAKLKELLEQDENYKLAHSALAVYLQKLDKFDEAITHAKRVVEIDPDDKFSYTQLSIICQRCGRIEEAEDALARARM